MISDLFDTYTEGKKRTKNFASDPAGNRKGF